MSVKRSGLPEKMADSTTLNKAAWAVGTGVAQADGDLLQRAARLTLTYVIGTYPVPTTTFIDREIELLRRFGVDLDVVSIRRPIHALSPAQRALRSSVSYVLPARASDVLRSHLTFLARRPIVYVSTLAWLVSRPHPSWRLRLRTVLHFGLAVHVARLLRERGPRDRIHAHFVDRAALVALVAGRLLDVPFSATAHAVDIYVAPVLLPEKLRGATFTATCTQYNRDHLLELAGPGSRPKVRCIYHGLDAGEFEPRDGAGRARPLLLAVGQLKEKKGFGFLLEACRSLLDRGFELDCEIVGEGPLRGALEDRIAELGLQDRVSLLGALPHPDVVEKYREATIFVLPCVLGADGDRDGIPNVVLEAMASELPVVSTRHSGIPEAVEDGRSGLLVPPADPAALTDAIAALMDDADLRRRLGRSGRERVAALFDAEVNVKKLLAELVR